MASKKPPHDAQEAAAAESSPDDPARRYASDLGLRIDKWLWCARFFKTRGSAQEAVEGGHVQVNGERVKASRHVKVGDRLRINRERELFEVDVTDIPRRRGPGAEARLNYRETPASEVARIHVRELNRLSGPVSDGRPDKRERRDLLRFVKGRGRAEESEDSDGATGDSDGDP